MIQSSIPYLGELIAGRYRLESVIGQGGMALVYSAHDDLLDRPVALKIAWSESGGIRKQEAMARFRREARVASALHHPGAVQVYDVGFCDGRMFLAMERLVGTTLTQHIETHAGLPLVEITRIATRLAEILQVAHAIPIVHRDLKPDNIYIDRSMSEERIVVLDFGLAFSLQSTDIGTGRLTQDNVTIGTPWYMSPEQIRDREIKTSSDIYSLGCVLFEVCTGESPYHGSSPARAITAHLTEPVPSLRERRPDLPIELEYLISMMLAKEPEERPSANQVHECLVGLVEEPEYVPARLLAG